MATLKELEFITDYAAELISILYGQFKGDRSPDIQKVIDAFSDPLNELEQVAKQLYTQLDLDDAVGVQLDGLGQLIGLPRNGLNDEDYRAALRFKVKLNRSFGQPEILIESLKFFTDSTIVELYETFPAAMFAFVNGSEGLAGLLAKMNRLRLGGVDFMYIAQVDSEHPFAFDSGGEADAGLGFAWDTGSGISDDDAGEYAWALPD